MKQKKWLAGAAALIPALLFLIKQTSPINNTYLVNRVVDGDTFYTEEKLGVRFDTFNAPELDDCGGKEAKAMLEKLILGKKVQLKIEARDNNGRQVASVWAGKTWVDQKMIESGWAAYSSSTIDKEHVLQNLDRHNKELKAGIYSEKCTQYTNPNMPKCNIKGNIAEEWTRKGEKVYHLPACAQYDSVRVEKWRGEEWFCTEEQARQSGYRKSDRCPGMQQ